MRLSMLAPWGPFEEPFSIGDLPDFVVMSGPNGSGKSSLLAGISDGRIVVDGGGQHVQLVQLGQFGSQGAEPVASLAAFDDRWAEFYEALDAERRALEAEEPDLTIHQRDVELRQRLSSRRNVPAPFLDVLASNAGKPLTLLTRGEVLVGAPLLTGSPRSVLGWSVGELVLSYLARREKNDYNRWRNEVRHESHPVLTDAEFVARFGPPPWELVNAALEAMRLPYAYDLPDESNPRAQYQAKLRDLRSGALLNPGQLSTGEQAVLTLALANYAAERQAATMTSPKVMLLDEVDAVLHPSMVRSLLDVVRDVLVNKMDCRVLLATHSATTVALAPPHAVFTVDRFRPPYLHSGRPDEVIRALTDTVPTLSIRVEDRKQVFVEAAIDQLVYEGLYATLKAQLNGDRSLTFIPASKDSRDGGSSVVTRLVRDLRTRGVDTVLGVVDRDSRQGAPDGVYWIGSRYSLENLILDPLLLGLHLLREHIADAQSLNLEPDARHIDVIPEDVPRLVGAVVAGLGFDADESPSSTVTCVGGTTYVVPASYLSMRGHDLEQLVLQQWPRLKEKTRQDRGKLIPSILRLTVPDHPWAIPSEAKWLLQSLLDH